ncbi:MAG: Gp138 family membrane-puncturing spike protein [Plesiomonas shigelloides]
MSSEDQKTEMTDSELADDSITQALMVTRTIMIGECVSFDEKRNCVNVQPVLKSRKSGWKDARNLPIIQDVPVSYYGAGGVVITYKPVKGDICELKVADRAIDGWKKLGGIVDPGKKRHHNMTDAIAYFGLNAFPNAYQGLRGGMDIRTRDGSTSLNVIDGSITATVGGNKVATMESSKVTFHVPIDAPNMKIAGKEMAGHSHGGVQRGNDNTGPNN